MSYRPGVSRIFGFTFLMMAFGLPASAQTATAAPPRRPDHRLQPARPSAERSVSLRKLAGCEATASYIAEAAVETVLSYRYNRWFMTPWAGGAEDGTRTDLPDDYTTTNNQEQGVDELDIVKTNGTHLFATEGGTLHILGSWPAAATRELAAVPSADAAYGLFLHENLVLVASQAWNPEVGLLRPSGGTRLELFDVTDPAAPRSVRTIDVEGWLADARLIDGHLYAVLTSYVELPSVLWDLAWRDDLGLPDLPWDADDAERERVLAEARAILAPLVREVISEYDVRELLPQVRDWSPDDPDAQASPLLQCSALYRPPQVSSLGVLSVLHLDLNDNGPITATGVMADGWTVYASATSLYVAQTSNWWWWGWAPQEMTTTIHKFELDPADANPVSYVASGQVDGWLLDQFALSEHDGHLRVATTEFDWWWGTTANDEPASLVTVLADDGEGTLRQTGRLGGLGPGEQIYAVRFMGDTGFVVTFRQVDPLYTLDLSDPSRPTVVGELEVTGYSSYLHPIGDGWLLAVGMEADEEGRVLGLSVSVFDVRDLAEPRLAHRYVVEGDEDSWSWSEALSDHHAFTYHRGVLSIPAYISGPEGRFSGLIVLAVDPESGISELGRIDHLDLAGDDYGAWMRRSVYIEDAVYSLSSAGVKVNDLHNPAIEYARVVFGE
jgi:uncharacterized secreted protein with C-terminal beta-propeller domain